MRPDGRPGDQPDDRPGDRPGDWPGDAERLIALQRERADAVPEPWAPDREHPRLGACWVCFPRGLAGAGTAGDPAWAAAVVLQDGRVVERRVVDSAAGASYRAGLLALREGPPLAQAVRVLTRRPDVLLVDASGRDHPRRYGLALHLGAVLDVPTVGVTHRPLLAAGDWPEDRRGATSPLRIDDAVVACWMRTRARTRPVVVHPGWRVDLDTAVTVVAMASAHRRTPEPLRRARQAARRARAASDRV